MLPSELFSIIAQFTPAVGRYAASHKASWDALKDKAHFWSVVFAHFTPLDYRNEWLDSLKIPYFAYVCALDVDAFQGSEHGDYMVIHGDILYHNDRWLTHYAHNFYISRNGQSYAYDIVMDPWRGIWIGHKWKSRQIGGALTRSKMKGFIGHHLMLWDSPTMFLFDAKTGEMAYVWHNVEDFLCVRAVSDTLVAMMYGVWDDICIRNLSGEIVHRILAPRLLDTSNYFQVISSNMYRQFRRYRADGEPDYGLWIRGMSTVCDKSKVIARIAHPVQLHGRIVFYVDKQKRLRKLQL